MRGTSRISSEDPSIIVPSVTTEKEKIITSGMTCLIRPILKVTFVTFFHPFSMAISSKDSTTAPTKDNSCIWNLFSIPLNKG